MAPIRRGILHLQARKRSVDCLCESAPLTLACVRRRLYGRLDGRDAAIQGSVTEHREECVQMPEGYCVKERKKVEIKDPQQVTMKNGRPAIQGTCPDCGTKIFKIGKLEG
jgi:Domain of unknown function (DUF5679)